MFDHLPSFFASHKKIFTSLLLVLGIIFTIYILFFNLGRFPFENWDEAFYAQTTKEMLKTKDFVALHWDNKIWLEKPPMFIWITSLFSFLFGLNELSVRLPSAISAFLIIGIVTIYSFKKYGLIPSFFTFFTLLLNNVFIWRARSGNIDTFVSLLILLTYFLLLSKNRYKYILLGFIFFCIYLTKASLVLFPLLIFLIYEFIYHRNHFKQNRLNYLKLLIIFIGLSGVWLLLGYLEVGTKFLTNYILHADQGAASFTVFKFDYIQHTYYVLQRRFFWFLIIGFLLAIWNIRKRENFLLIFYSSLLLLELSFTTRDNNWYLIPSMPFWSILISFAVFELINKITRKPTLKFIFGTVLICISSYIFYRTYTINISPILNSSSTIDQAESARKIKLLSKAGEVVVRLGPLIPTTLYYDDHKTLAYVSDTSTQSYWISKKDINSAMKKKKINWIVGTKDEVSKFLNTFDKIQFEKTLVKNQEEILKVL